ncbi:MAG: PAS domain S-box protein [Nitrospinota bacterium]|nr:PAS domain S-box protein [Nitrospinota bacterium]
MAPDGRILYANDSACTTYGFSREELIRMTVFELNPDYSRESWMELVKQTREAGHSRYESRNLRKDGGIFPVEVTANHLEFGGQEYIFGFVRDITERKESEEALRLTQFSVERAGDGRFQKVNDAATRCFGYSREELLSMSVWDIQLDRSAEAWPGRWEEIKRTGTSTFETRYAAKDGRTVPVEITTSYLEFGSKEWSFGFVRDITERKRTEEALRPSEERHRILFERANNAINVLDETGRILDCNLKACELFGYEREELIGKPRTEMMPPERRAILSETIAQIMRTGQERFESVAIRKDGAHVPIEVSAGVIELDGKKCLLNFVRDITERKESEETLRLTQFSVERAENAIFWLGPDGRILNVNNAACRHLGYSREELLSMTVSDINPAFPPEKWAEYWQEAKKGRGLTFESTQRRKDGRDVPVEISTNYLKFNGKEYDFAFVRDITERKEAEEETQRITERLSMLIESLPEGVAVYTCEAEGDFAATYVSENIREITGFTEEDFTSNPGFWAEHIHPEDRDGVFSNLSGLFETGHHEHEYRFQIADGSHKWFGDRLHLVKRPDGTINHIEGVWFDITERKQAEEALRLTQFSVDHAAHAVYWVGEDGRILYANEAARQDLGYSMDEMLSLTILDINPDYSPDQWAAQWNRLKEKGSYTFEGRNTAKDGRDFPVEVTSNYLEFNGKEYVLGFARDITDRREMQEKLRQGQKMEAVGQLASGVAHNFNNILTVIMGNASLLVEAAADPETRRRLSNVEKAALSGAKTVERLQDFARRRADRPMGRIDLNTVIQDVSEMTRPRWMNESAQKGIRVEMSVYPEAAQSVIEGKVAEIQEALINLVNNALDAMPAGGRLQLSTENVEGRVRLTVADTGHVIPPEIRERVFEPFFTSKGEQGTGLGLSMVYGIVERHGGSLEIESPPGEGTILRLTFPVAVGESKEASTSVPAAAPSVSGRVLVIDDEEEIPHLLELWLHAMGLEIEGVSDPREGLKAFQNNPFDLVITDLGMPDMTGLEVAKAVKEISPSAAVVLMTGWGGRPEPRKNHGIRHRPDPAKTLQKGGSRGYGFGCPQTP